MHKLNLRDYQEFIKTVITYDQQNESDYLKFGLHAELGEVAGVYAKYKRGDYNCSEMAEKLLYELGDVVWFVSRLLYLNNISEVEIDSSAIIDLPVKDTIEYLINNRLDDYISFLIVVDAIARSYNTNIEDLINMNIKKLSARKNKNTIKGSGEQR